MLDFSIPEFGVIGVVALVVLGPEKLPKVARTVGALMGKARRYVNDVKAEVNRSIELEELQKVKRQFEDAASEVQSSVQKDWNAAQDGFRSTFEGLGQGLSDASAGASVQGPAWEPPPPQYQRPNKRWRVKKGSLPRWYKQRQGLKGHVQSGAARVARHRPKAMAGPGR